MTKAMESCDQSWNLTNFAPEFYQIFALRLERGGEQQIFLSCACFLITQPFLNIYRHAIHQIKAEYHSYLLVSMILYNLSENRKRNIKLIFLTFIFRTPISP